MRVRGIVKILCKDCQMIKRGKRRYVYCKSNPKHKQRQGFHTLTDSLSQLEHAQCGGCGVYQPKRNMTISSPVSGEQVDISNMMNTVSHPSTAMPQSFNFQYTPVLGLSPLILRSFNHHH